MQHWLLRILSACFLAFGMFIAVSVLAQDGQHAFHDEVSFTHDIQPILKNFCTTCHAGDDPEGDLLLTEYAEVRKQTERGELLERINDDEAPMPEDGLMPKHLRRIFQLWADGGYLNQGRKEPSRQGINYEAFTPPQLHPVDISKAPGFELLEAMQGHWVGSMELMGRYYEWMAFDYRAIAPAHVHGIFEGGTVGNLLTAFFVADFFGTPTIVARNGGVLNGIYRISYFVLDSVNTSGRQTRYRLVDAYGGKDIMFMELRFVGNSLTWTAWTSRLGLTAPKQHMLFKAQRKRPEIAAQAAQQVGFPRMAVDYRFPNPLPTPTWTGEYPWTSATYISDIPNKSLVELGTLARDPRRIDQIPHLAQLTVKITRNQATENQKLHVYLSQKALTDPQGKFLTYGGYIRLDLLDTLLSFPELSGNTDTFTFTYLHPGDYYLTVIADRDDNGYPSAGDISHPSLFIHVDPETHAQVTVENLNILN